MDEGPCLAAGGGGVPSHHLCVVAQARSKLQSAEEQHELFKSQLEGSAPSPEAEVQEVADLRQQLQKLVEQHQSELQQQAAMSMEEIEYLKRKNDAAWTKRRHVKARMIGIIEELLSSHRAIYPMPSFS